ncbi:MAG: DEAD/DEAH box helicase [Bacteroidetes bacterium B1(2017)]|nr:MAG: DEAD/DEAH box helicase [Bacteroidetes bacterium B1(2017)]
MLNFEDLNLNKQLLNALQDLDYMHPTPIQEKSYSVIMSGADVVGVAQTGTGKTFAYLLPLLRMHKYSESKYPKILILVPTRELVAQVVAEIEKLSKYMTIRFAGIYGGSNINPQKLAITAGLDILVSTPGRLVDMAMLGVLRLKSVHHFVIDEVDEMMEIGFRAQLTTILDLLPPKRQNIFFSATLGPDVQVLINTFTKNPQQIEVAVHGTPLEKIKQSAYDGPNYFTKVNLLNHLLEDKKVFNKVMVFVASIKLADRLFAQLLPTFGEELALIHSNKSQNNRFLTLANFHQGLNRVLIATDIAARGLDIYEVSHVINFDTPIEAGDYIHRIGRTGRAGKNGIAITFFNEVEEPYLEEIEALMKLKVARKRIPKEVVISSIFSDEERPQQAIKSYLKAPSRAGAPVTHHEKKAKNMKVNLGGPRKRNPNKNKPRNRAVERNRARKK